MSNPTYSETMENIITTIRLEHPNDLTDTNITASGAVHIFAPNVLYIIQPFDGIGHQVTKMVTTPEEEIGYIVEDENPTVIKKTLVFS